MQLDVYNMKGEVVDTIELSDDIFAIEPNEDAIYRVLVAQQANRRQGTHKVKDRSEVRGGGRKPFRQKGTGRSRQGSSRSPKHVGGGVVFGLADVPAATAAMGMETAGRIERIVERGHETSCASLPLH